MSRIGHELTDVGLGPQVKVSNLPGKKLEHQGIRVQLLGQIELLSARGHFHDFVALGAALCPLHKLVCSATISLVLQ